MRIRLFQFLLNTVVTQFCILYTNSILLITDRFFVCSVFTRKLSESADHPKSIFDHAADLHHPPTMQSTEVN